MRIRQKNTYGLALQANSLTVPDGGSERLVNVLLQRDNIYIKERGFENIYTSALGEIYGIFEFDSFIVLIFNSTVLRINKLGIAQGTATASSQPFEIDGTLRPADNSLPFAPYSIIASNRAFFCTPEGIRVMRSSSSNASDMPGVEAPTLRWNSTLINQGGAFEVTQNDFPLTAVNTSGANPEFSDAPADRVVSYRTVLRKEMPDGTFIESRPSAPIFAYNTMSRRACATVGTVVTITQTAHGMTGTGVLKLKNATDASGVLFPLLDGIYTFTVASVNTYTINISSVIGTVPAAFNALVAQDRYSIFRCYFSANAAIGDFIDVYASTSDLDLSDASNLGLADSDYYFLREIKLTSIPSPRFIDIDMVRTYAQKGFALYSNPSDGDLSRQPNTLPPGASTIEEWKGSLFYGNTYSRHSIRLTQIGGEFFNTSNIQLKFLDTGFEESFSILAFSGTTSLTIRRRVQSLVGEINGSATSNFYAYYSDDTTEFPGELVIESRVPNRAFGIYASHPVLATAEQVAKSFEPNLGFSTSVGVTLPANSPESTQDINRNRVWWSKQNQPEAVPYFVDVGQKEEDILRILRTRESMIVVKRDGIFALFGDPSTGFLTVREIDNTIKGISSTGVARMGNRVYAKTNQGIVAISETSLSLVSRGQIEPLIKVSEEFSVRDTVMYALEDDRQLYIATAKNPSDNSKIVYSYNALTQTWSELSKLFKWGFVVNNNFTVGKVYQNNRVITDGTSVFLERKDNLLTDWADENFDDTVASKSVDGYNIELAGTYPVGAQIAWDNGSAIKLFRVTSVNIPNYTLNIPFTGVATDGVTVYTPITSVIRTSPIDGGDSSIVKQFTTFDINTRYDAISACSISFRSDWFEYGTEVGWEKQEERRGWGMQQWGRFPWGQATAQALQYLTMPSQIVQTEVPRTLQRSTFLQAEITHSVACEGLFIQQMAFNVRTASERPAR
jgi:hypothetical protein